MLAGWPRRRGLHGWPTAESTSRHGSGGAWRLDDGQMGHADGAQSQARVPEEEMLLAWSSIMEHGAAGLSGSSARSMI